MELLQLLEEIKKSFNSRRYFIDGWGKGGWTLIHAAFEVCERLDDKEALQLDKALAEKQQLSAAGLYALDKVPILQHQLAMRAVEYIRRLQPEIAIKDDQRGREL